MNETKYLKAGDTLSHPLGTYITPKDGWYQITNTSVVRIGDSSTAKIFDRPKVLQRAALYVNGVCVQEEIWKYLDEGNPNTESPNKMIYDDSYNYKWGAETLKAKCWICMKEISVYQQADYGSDKYVCRMSCCGRTEEVKLTKKQIEENNASGFWMAFIS